VLPTLSLLFKYSFLQELLCYRADAPIIGYLLEHGSEREFASRFDEDGHCFGETSADLPIPKRLSWKLSNEVCLCLCVLVACAHNVIIIL